MHNDDDDKVLEGVFAIAKPTLVSSADVLQKLQAMFATSALFAPLLRSQPERPSKSDSQLFKLGHGGTLDPLAAGVLIVGIGRGTKHLQHYLACNKTYETVVLFGTSTDTYDCTGNLTEESDCQHVTKELVEQQLTHFRGSIRQAPPVYSALKINGKKACEYPREGKELPRDLESREMQVDECTLLEWFPGGQHHRSHPCQQISSSAPAARIRLTVGSGFYVRSFAHDLGIACQSNSHMAALLRTRQATFTVSRAADCPELVPAVTYDDLDAGEHVWAAKLKPQLETWVRLHPAATGHVDGRGRAFKVKAAEEKANRPRQRFRGEWVADTKRDRIKQQGGKHKGKWNKTPRALKDPPDQNITVPSSSSN